FRDMNNDVLHPFVRFLRAADEQELFTLGDPFVPIDAIEADAHQTRQYHLFRFRFTRHMLLRFEKVIPIYRKSDACCRAKQAASTEAASFRDLQTTYNHYTTQTLRERSHVRTLHLRPRF